MWESGESGKVALQVLVYARECDFRENRESGESDLPPTGGRALRRPRPNVEAAGGYIAGAFVRQDARRANAGRMLVAAAEDWLRTQGITNSELHVLYFNEGARRFWEEIGYEPLTLGMRKKLGESRTED